MENKKPRVLSSVVLERFLSAEQMNELYAQYKSNRKAHHLANRETSLAKEMTEVEKNAVRDYVTTNESAKNIAIKHGLPEKGIVSRLERACARLLYHNRASLA